MRDVRLGATGFYRIDGAVLGPEQASACLMRTYLVTEQEAIAYLEHLPTICGRFHRSEEVLREYAKLYGSGHLFFDDRLGWLCVDIETAARHLDRGRLILAFWQGME